MDLNLAKSLLSFIAPSEITDNFNLVSVSAEIPGYFILLLDACQVVRTKQKGVVLTEKRNVHNSFKTEEQERKSECKY